MKEFLIQEIEKNRTLTLRDMSSLLLRSEFDCRGNDPSLTERRFRILEEAAQKARESITLRLIYHQERHCEIFVQKAIMENQCSSYIGK